MDVALNVCFLQPQKCDIYHWIVTHREDRIISFIDLNFSMFSCLFFALYLLGPPRNGSPLLPPGAIWRWMPWRQLVCCHGHLPVEHFKSPPWYSPTYCSVFWTLFSWQQMFYSGLHRAAGLQWIYAFILSRPRIIEIKFQCSSIKAVRRLILDGSWTAEQVRFSD